MNIAVCSDNKRRFTRNEVNELRKRGHTVTYVDDEKYPTLVRTLSRYDVVWNDFCGSRSARFSSQARKVNKAKLVVRVHAPRALRRIKEVHWQNVNLVIFDQPVLMKQAQRIDKVLGRARCETCRLAVDTEFFSPEKGRGWPDRVGMLGMCRRAKGTEEVLETLHRLRRERMNLEFWSKGFLAGERKYKDSLERMADRFGITHRFSPWRSEIDRDLGSRDPRARWLNEIGILCSNSDVEGTHLAVAEAMAASCCAAVRNWNGADSLYPDDVIVGGKTSLYEQLRWFAKMGAAKRKAEGMRLRRYAIENFGVKNVVDRLESLFESVL